MIARLALGNVLPRGGAHNSLHYPAFVLVLVATAAFYAFGSVDEQLSFVVGGVAPPRGLESLVDGATMALSLVLGLVMLVMGLRVVDLRRHEMHILSAFGLSEARIFLLMLCEQGIVLVMAFAVGLAVGLLFSHVLVFVTAALFAGHAEGFGAFLCVRALGTAARGVLPLVGAMVVSAALLVPRRGGSRRKGFGVPRRGAACAWLVVGVALVALSCLGLGWPCVVVVRGSDGWLRPVMQGAAISLVALFMGTWATLRGLGEDLRCSPGRLSLHRGYGVLGTISRMELGRLLERRAPSLAFATVCLALVWYQLAGALGSCEMREASFDVPSMVYLGCYASFLLCVAAGTVLSATVGAHAISSNGEYLTLYGLGFPSGSVRRSQRRRIAWGFLVPLAMSFLEVVGYLAKEGLGTTPYGAGWSFQGVLLSLGFVGVILAAYLGTTLVSTRNSLRQAAVARHMGW